MDLATIRDIATARSQIAGLTERHWAHDTMLGVLDNFDTLLAERERLQGELTAATAEIARLKRKVYFGNCKEFYGSPLLEDKAKPVATNVGGK